MRFLNESLLYIFFYLINGTVIIEAFTKRTFNLIIRIIEIQPELNKQELMVLTVFSDITGVYRFTEDVKGSVYFIPFSLICFELLFV
jgi:hypothetical protein